MLGGAVGQRRGQRQPRHGLDGVQELPDGLVDEEDGALALAGVEGQEVHSYDRRPVAVQLQRLAGAVEGTQLVTGVF